MTPDLELQRRLVAKFSEKISVVTEDILRGDEVVGTQDYFIWKGKASNLGNNVGVRDTEWLHIVNLIEQTGMDVNQLSAYADALDKVCVPTHICPLTHWQAVTCASWQQRAQAMVDCGII